MNYKLTNKAQKQKNTKNLHLISSDLIKGKRFTEIINRASKEEKLTNRDRYIYGYSLLQTERNLEALTNLWPLLTRGYDALREDCTKIANHVFASADKLFSTQMSDDMLHTLFYAGKDLAPQNKIYSILKQRLFNMLWQQKEYERLERILKSSEEFSGVLVENLSKIGFLQPQKKLMANIPAFVGHVLTGGACLIMRESIYYKDIDNTIHLLANELKYLFWKLKKNQSFAWDIALFDSFVDYEANILTHILPMVIEDNNAHFDIVPTPSYIIHYDASTKRISEKFLPWLASKSKELFEAYNADTHYAVLWVLSGEKAQYSKISKSVHKSLINPYLLLAGMLRSTSIKKETLGTLVQLSDFTNFKQAHGIFKEVVVQTVKFMVNNQTNIELQPTFWEILFKFYPVLQDQYCKKILIAQLVTKLTNKFLNKASVDLGELQSIAQQIDANDIVDQIRILYEREQVCISFLSNIEGEKESEKIISTIKDEAMLRTHLTLIADCCVFVRYEELPIQFFHHIKSIVKNNAINKLVLLRELFDWDFDCTCVSCREIVYNGIPDMAKKLNLSVVTTPDMCSHDYIQQSQLPTPKSSAMSQIDPFKTLDASLTDSKYMIMQKVMILIQQSPEQMAIYRQAQSALFNPAQRFLYQYLRFLGYKDSNDNNINNMQREVVLQTNSSIHNIPLRQEFLDEC